MTRFWRIAFWTAAAVAFVMAALPQPPDLPLPPSDKLQHMLAFGVLAVLGAMAYRGLSLLLLAIGLIAFGALIEVVQMIPALHRDAEVLDLVADGAAIAIVVALTALLRGQFQQRSR